MNSEYEFNVEDKQESASVISKIKAVIWKIPRKARIVLSIISFTIFIVFLLNIFKPEAQKREIPETVVRVDVVEAGLSSYPIVVTANGTIEAETRGNLVAQISGEIVSMADNFKTGGSFQKGDVLIQIDQRDYQADLSRAVASLSQADAAYRQELANAKQAQEDWKRLGNSEPAPELVSRTPQLAAARAQLDSAKAAHETANLNLSRTKITAPYSGRIIRRDAVLGQYVGVGTPIAEVFSTGGVEVRLPISQDEYTQLGLDKLTQDQQNPDQQNPGPQNGESQFDVVLSSTIGGRTSSWDAKITRTDSTFDINTRQIDVIAQVIDPFGVQSGQSPLKIGQFVNARIQGRTVDNVFVIPNKSIREGSYTYVVRDERLVKQNIDILWQDDQNTLVAGSSATQDASNSIVANELIVTTSLNSTLAGAKAKLPEDFVAGRATPIEQDNISATGESSSSAEDDSGLPETTATPAMDNTAEDPDASQDEDATPAAEEDEQNIEAAGSSDTQAETMPVEEAKSIVSGAGEPANPSDAAPE